MFYVLETDGLVMPCVAVETRVVCCCCSGQRPALSPRPFHSVAAHFPRGISYTTSALSSSPPRPAHSKSQRASGTGFSSIKAIHTHLLRGLEVVIQAGSHHHDLAGASAHFAFFYNITKEKMLILTLSGKIKNGWGG